MILVSACSVCKHFELFIAVDNVYLMVASCTNSSLFCSVLKVIGHTLLFLKSARPLVWPTLYHPSAFFDLNKSLEVPTCYGNAGFP